MHTGERPFECTWRCGLSFVTDSVRKEHEMTVHTGKYSKYILLSEIWVKTGGNLEKESNFHFFLLQILEFSQIKSVIENMLTQKYLKE